MPMPLTWTLRSVKPAGGDGLSEQARWAVRAVLAGADRARADPAWADAPGPVVTSSTANLAANANTITISGFGFDATASHNTVAFNDGAVGSVTWQPTTAAQLQPRYQLAVGNADLDLTLDVRRPQNLQHSFCLHCRSQRFR